MDITFSYKYLYRNYKDSEDDNTPVVRPNINKKTRRYMLDSESDSDYEQIDDHENNEAYHTINDFNSDSKSSRENYDEEYYSDFNSDSGKNYLANKD